MLLLMSLARGSKLKRIVLTGCVSKAGGEAYRWRCHCYCIWQYVLSQTDLRRCYICVSQCIQSTAPNVSALSTPTGRNVHFILFFEAKVFRYSLEIHKNKTRLLSKKQRPVSLGFLIYI